jgi:DNA-binding Lrp family transcriptional regulator
MKELSPLQRRILGEITWNARASTMEIARKCRLKNHTVRYAIEQLTSRFGLMPLFFTDPYLQGQTPFIIYFSLRTSDQVQITSCLKYLAKLPDVQWLSSVIGRHQYALAVRTHGLAHLDSFLMKIDERFSNILVDKKSVITIAAVNFMPWFAFQGQGERPFFQYTASSSPTTLDEVDKKILSVLGERPLTPVSELAKSLAIPSSTVSYRLEKLVKSKVILGFGYAASEINAKARFFKILIRSEGFGSALYQRLVTFGSTHPSVYVVEKTIGAWDVELGVCLYENRDIEPLINQIHILGDKQLRELAVHAWGTLHKV